MKTRALINLALALVCGALVIGGCGAGPQAIDEDYVKKSTDNAKLARSLFDSVQGNWDSLSADDKAKLASAYGSEESAKTVWATMANPPTGGGIPAAPTAPAPK